MGETTDVNYVITTQKEDLAGTIEFEFDDSQVESQINSDQSQSSSYYGNHGIQVLKVASSQCQPEDTYYEETSQETFNVTEELAEEQSQEIEEVTYEESGILEERLSDYEEYDENIEEERLSDYETNNKNQQHPDELQVDHYSINDKYIENAQKIISLGSNNNQTPQKIVSMGSHNNQFTQKIISMASRKIVSMGNGNIQSPQKAKLLNFPLGEENKSFELPIIKKPPIIITSKLISRSNQNKPLNTVQILKKGIQQSLIKQCKTERAVSHDSVNAYKQSPIIRQYKNGNFKNTLAKSFKVVTSSKTLTNCATPPRVVTVTGNPNILRKENDSEKIVIKEEVCIKKEDRKNNGTNTGTNYDSDSEVLLGFDTQSGSYRTRTGMKIEPNVIEDSEQEESLHENSISAADFDSFEQTYNTMNTHNERSTTHFSDSDISISEKSSTIMKVPNQNMTAENPKFETVLKKHGKKTAMTRFVPTSVPTNKQNIRNSRRNSKIVEENKPNKTRTSEEMNVALAMQELKEIETNVIKNIKKETTPAKKRSKSSDQQQEKVELTEEDIELNLALAKFFMECNIPLGVVEDHNFKEFVRLLKPSYVEKLPASKELLQAILKL